MLNSVHMCCSDGPAWWRHGIANEKMVQTLKRYIKIYVPKIYVTPDSKHFTNINSFQCIIITSLWGYTLLFFPSHGKLRHIRIMWFAKGQTAGKKHSWSSQPRMANSSVWALMLSLCFTEKILCLSDKNALKFLLWNQ